MTSDNPNKHFFTLKSPKSDQKQTKVFFMLKPLFLVKNTFFYIKNTLKQKITLKSPKSDQKVGYLTGLRQIRQTYLHWCVCMETPIEGTNPRGGRGQLPASRIIPENLFLLFNYV